MPALFEVTPGMQGNERKIKITKWIHGTHCVVRVQVDALVFDGEPSEPCLEPATLRWLDELQATADTGNAEALAAHGEVYVRRSA